MPVVGRRPMAVFPLLVLGYIAMSMGLGAHAICLGAAFSAL